MKDIKLIVAGGGTAGHINAGLSIMEEFEKKHSATCLFVGTKRGMESKLLPRSNRKIAYISSRGLSRQSLPIFIYSLLLLPVSLIQSLIIVSRFKPDAVIGVGGYSSGPVILASWLFRVPIFLLEQNAILGLSNRLLIGFAKKLFSAFPIKNKKYETKIVKLGNPIRSDIKKSKGSLKPFTIFIFGGSQGARAINQAVAACIPMLNKLKDIKIIHQAGRLDVASVKKAYKDADFEYEVHEYIYDIASVYQQTDLVISRAGASTIFELLSARLPSILIPLPTAADDHQRHNAMFLSDNDCCELLEQKKLSPEKLYERISYYTSDTSRLSSMKKALEKLARTNKNQAQKLIVEQIIPFIDEKKSGNV